MPRVLPIVLAVALWVYGLIDCAQTPEEEVPPGLAKPVWLLIIMLIPGLGAVAWLVVKGINKSSAGSPLGSRRQRRPSAPDDDPEFLANLDWQARKAHYDRLRRERESQAGGPATSGPEEPAAEQPPEDKAGNQDPETGAR